MNNLPTFRRRLTTGIFGALLCGFGTRLLWPANASAQVGDDANGACLRVVRNELGGDAGNWGQAGAPVLFTNGGTASTFTGVGPASFTLNGSSDDYSLLGVQLSFVQNKTYSLRVTVANYTGNYPGSNFEILGAAPGSFTGVTRLNFTGDGVYALVFTYLGPSEPFLARIGINVDAGSTSGSGPGGFTVSDISLEQLPSSSSVPSEYVTSGYAWGFNYPALSSYDASTGKLSESGGQPCARTYANVWAVTADSFGDNTYSFPNQLANFVAEGYVFLVNTIPGRTLATAQVEIDPLLSNSIAVQTDQLLPSTSLPTTAATPNGLIVEGGVDDIVENSSAAQLEAVGASIVSDIEAKNLKAILMTVSPFGDNANWTTAREQVRLAYNAWVRAQASPQNGIYVYDMAASQTLGGLADDSNSELLASSFDTGDGLHPNLAGGQQIAQQLSQVLDAIGLPISATATSIDSGASTTLTVTPAGSGPFAYQWYEGPTGNTSKPVPGATGPSFTTSALTATTSFWVRITPATGGVVNSESITINVGAPTPIDGPIPPWALGALGVLLVGITSRRIRRAV
jgi:lysophospholipase L1-like esterase